MWHRQDVIAMILAGGQGARLGVLTKYLAKPAVPFGSRYRIIDFPLSNCTNSGIETVGVLTQYQPLVLNTYIGNGHPWDLDRNKGGAFILPPYQSNARSDWYKGTANAIYQNIDFIENYDPKHVADPVRRPYLQDGLRQDAAGPSSRRMPTRRSPSSKCPGRKRPASAS